MKNILLVLSLLLSSFSLYAQYSNDSSKVKLQKPIVVVKGDDLQKFPSNNLLEALEGRIPGYDSFSHTANDFLFIVDGIYTTNINSININEISEISFYRGGFTGSDGIYASSAGTFVIRTKRAEYEQPLTTTFLVQAGNDNPTNQTDNYLSQSCLFGVHKGYSMLKYGFGLNYSTMYNNGSFANDNTFKVNANIDIKPLKWIETGLYINFNPNKINQNEPLTKSSLAFKHSEKSNFLNGNFYLTVNPLKGLINTFTVAKYKSSSDINRTIYSATSDNVSLFDGHHDNAIMFYNNKLSYKKGWVNDKLKFGADFIYNRIVQNSDKEENFSYNSTNGFSTLDTYNLNESFIGELTLNLNDMLLLEGGYRLDKMGSISVGDNIIESPYASVTFELQKALYKNSEVISSTKFNIAFSKRQGTVRNYETFYSTGYRPDLLPSVSDPLGNKVYSFSTTVGLWNDRVVFSGDWFNCKHSTHIPIDMSYMSVNMIIMHPTELETNGWRIWLNTDIVRSSDFLWKAGVNFNKQKSKADLQTKMVSPVIRNTNFIYNPNKEKTYLGLLQPIFDDFYQGVEYGGIQNNISYKNLSLEINGSFCLNKKSFVPSLTPSSTVINDLVVSNYELIDYNSFVLNYMAVGYSLNRSVLKYVNDAGLFLVAKNILEMNNRDNLYIRSPKYLGVALKVIL